MSPDQDAHNHSFIEIESRARKTLRQHNGKNWEPTVRHGRIRSLALAMSHLDHLRADYYDAIARILRLETYVGTELLRLQSSTLRNEERDKERGRLTTRLEHLEGERIRLRREHRENRRTLDEKLLKILNEIAILHDGD